MYQPVYLKPASKEIEQFLPLTNTHTKATSLRFFLWRMKIYNPLNRFRTKPYSLAISLPRRRAKFNPWHFDYEPEDAKVSNCKSYFKLDLVPFCIRVCTRITDKSHLLICWAPWREIPMQFLFRWTKKVTVKDSFPNREVPRKTESSESEPHIKRQLVSN